VTLLHCQYTILLDSGLSSWVTFLAAPGSDSVTPNGAFQTEELQKLGQLLLQCQCTRYYSHPLNPSLVSFVRVASSTHFSSAFRDLLCLGRADTDSRFDGHRFHLPSRSRYPSFSFPYSEPGDGLSSGSSNTLGLAGQISLSSEPVHQRVFRKFHYLGVY